MVEGRSMKGIMAVPIQVGISSPIEGCSGTGGRGTAADEI